jgi:hypothetical protein
MTEIIIICAMIVLAVNALVVSLILRRINTTMKHMLDAADYQQQLLSLLFMTRQGTKP